MVITASDVSPRYWRVANLTWLVLLGVGLCAAFIYYDSLRVMVN